MSRRFALVTEGFSGIERHHRKWLVVLGLVVTPLIIASLLAWGFGAVDQRLGKVQAVVVNNDKMVEFNGQKVPLGRQFAAKLIAGNDQYDWQLDTESSANRKLKKGSVVAVVTIPHDFSKRAISYAQHPTAAEQANIQVMTSTNSSVLDASVTKSLVASARQAFNTEMTKTYLNNVYVSYGTLADNLEDAADGTDKLANGSATIQKGNKSLASGAYKLSDGLDQLTEGTSAYVAGVGKVASGASKLADGTKKLAKGTKPLNTGAQQLADGLDQSRDGSKALAQGLKKLDKNVGTLKSGTQSLADGTSGLAKLTQKYEEARAACADGDDDKCAAYGKALAGSPHDVTITQLAAALHDGASELNVGVAGTSSTPGLASGIAALSTGASKLDGGLQQLSSGASALAKGTKKLNSGTNSLAAGATKLATGAQTAAKAGSQLVEGAGQSAGGAAKLGNGGDKLATGGKQLTTGIDKVGSGLHRASEAVPQYTKSERTQLSKVVASPLKATSSPLHGLFGADVMAWVVALALWIGLLAVYLILPAVPRHARFSTKSVFALAARGYVPGALIGVGAGLAVGIFAAVVTNVGIADGAALVGLNVLAGLSFAAVQQGLCGLMGWFGRLLSLLMAVLIAMSVMIATVPGILIELAALTPLSSLIDGMQAQLIGASGTATAITGLVIWGLIGFVMSVLSIIRARSTKSPDARVPEVPSIHTAP